MPYPNEHAARLKSPGIFDEKSFRRTNGSGKGKVQGVTIPKSIAVIWGKLKGKSAPSDPVIAQALRFPISRWTKDSALKWLKTNKIKYILFEEASGKTKDILIDVPQLEPGLSREIFNDRNVFIFSDITIPMSKNIVQELIRLDSLNNQPINIFINSFGGATVAMNALLDGFNLVKSPINTIAIGDASSAGAVLFSAGNKRYIGEHSRVMIHEVVAFAAGTLQDLNEQVTEINKENIRMLEVIAKNTGKTLDEIKSILYKKNLWLNAKEAVEFGIADEILTSVKRQELKLDDKLKMQYPIKFDEWCIEDNLSEVPVLRIGNYNHSLYEPFKITQTDLLKFKENFDNKIRGVDIAIDYTHDNDKGEKIAAGWFKSLFTKNNNTELWAKTEWTPKAKQCLKNKEFKYYSPEFVFDYRKEDGTVVKNVLLGGALTNRPFQKWEAIKLSEPYKDNGNVRKIKQKEKNMTQDELIKKLSETGIDVNHLQTRAETADSLEVENTQLKGEVTELTLAKEKNEKIKAENEKLKEENQTLAKEKTIDKLIVEGKILPTSREKILKQFTTAESIDTFYKDEPKIVNTNAQGDSGSKDNTLTEAEQEVLKNDPSLKKEEVIKARNIHSPKGE